MKEIAYTGYLYVVFVKSMTGISKITRKIVDYEYTHMSLCFDRKMEDFVTFARRNLYTPLDAGIVWERRGNYAFEDMEYSKVKIFRIPISEEEYERIVTLIREYEQDEEYMFNLLSMVTMPVFHGFQVYKTHNCMSFISIVLEQISSIRMEKAYYKYMPSELAVVMKDYAWFEGKLKKKEESITAKAENIPCKKEMFRKNCEIIGTLLYRMIRYPVLCKMRIRKDRNDL